MTDHAHELKLLSYLRDMVPTNPVERSIIQTTRYAISEKLLRDFQEVPSHSQEDDYAELD